MTRRHVPLAPLLAALLAAWQPSIAGAAEAEVQLWQIVTATGDLDQDTRITLDASQRWRAERSGGEQQTLRFNLDQTIAKGVRIGGGAMVLEADGTTELRPHQQVTVTLGRFESRTRLEQRFFDGGAQVELRLRQRVQYHQPLGSGWRASLGGEWFGILQSRVPGASASTEQWRALAGIACKLDDKLELSANYWLLVFPRAGQADRIVHVPQTVLSVRF